MSGVGAFFCSALHSAQQHRCVQWTQRRAGEVFLSSPLTMDSQQRAAQVNKLVWESFQLHPSSTKAIGGNQIFVLGAFMFVPFGVTAIDLLSNNTYGHGTPTWEAMKKVSWVLLQLFAPKVLRNSHPNTIPSIRLPYSSELNRPKIDLSRPPMTSNDYQWLNCITAVPWPWQGF